MRGHQEYVIEEIKGLYNRRPNNVIDRIPPGHLYSAENVEYKHNSIIQRGGMATLFTAASNILRFHRYNKASGARYIVLRSNGALYDSNDLTTVIAGPFATATDFSGITLYDRFYFFVHDRSKGIGTTGLYVYTGTGTARLAAGAKPASAITVAVSGTAGVIELGNRLWYVAYETDTGHITKPNATGTLFNQNVASRKASLTNIPTGPAGTAKRHILCTKRVDPYTGNPNDYELFFIPGGIIENNTATTLTVDFYDADLVASADYLFDEMEEIPAGVQLSHYNGRLFFCAEGEPDSSVSINPPYAPGEKKTQQPLAPGTIPPYTVGGVVRASKAGFPESFSNVDGFILVDPDDNGNVKSFLPQKGQLYLFKDDRAYVTSDNGEEPAHWPVVQIDSGLGSCPFGVAKVLGNEGPSEDIALVATKTGLHTFNGAFSDIPLTWKVENNWRHELSSLAYFSKTQILVNTIDKLIYCIVGSPNDMMTILVGDFKNGLDPENIRWATWRFHSGVTLAPIALGIYFPASGKPHLLFTPNGDTKIYSVGPDNQFEDNTNGQTASFITEDVIPSTGVNHFVGMRFSVIGTNSTTITTELFKDSAASGVAGPSISISATSAAFKTLLLNIKGNALRVKFSLTNSSAGKEFKFSAPFSYFAKKLGYGPV